MTQRSNAGAYMIVKGNLFKRKAYFFTIKVLCMVAVGIVGQIVKKTQLI